MADPPTQSEPPRSGRYETLMKLASGGMGTVYLGYLRGSLGFRHLVAIKRLHPHLLEDPQIRKTAAVEANLASRVHHANVVSVRDVEVVGDSVDLVMDYVEGASLAELVKQCKKESKAIPVDVALTIVVDACMGLHAAHEATDETGAALGVVHRDVSPQNILVGVDGVSRVTDFGIAKCLHGTDPSTQQGMLKGKLGYMAPEYVASQRLDRRADVFALGVVLWELLMGRRLFQGESQVDSIRLVLRTEVPSITSLPAALAERMDEVLSTVLAHKPEARFERTIAFATAIESVARGNAIELSHRRVAEFVQEVMRQELAARQLEIRDRLATRESLLPKQPLARPSSPSNTSIDSVRSSDADAQVQGLGTGTLRASGLPTSHARGWLMAGVVAVVFAAAAIAGWSASRPQRTETPAPGIVASASSTTSQSQVNAPSALTPTSIDDAAAVAPTASAQPVRPTTPPTARTATKSSSAVPSQSAHGSSTTPSVPAGPPPNPYGPETL